METNFNFKSQICTTVEQSQRLLSLGLKKETADMVWLDHAMTEEYEDWQARPMGEWDGWDKNEIPAWSLHRLFQIYLNGMVSSSWNMAVFNWDDLIDCIESRVKEGYLNKEYLV